MAAHNFAHSSAGSSFSDAATKTVLCPFILLSTTNSPQKEMVCTDVINTLNSKIFAAKHWVTGERWI